MIGRWNGHIREFYGFAVNLAEAQRILYPDNKVAPASGAAPKLGPGTGRAPEASGPATVPAPSFIRNPERSLAGQAAAGAPDPPTPRGMATFLAAYVAARAC
ncbi:hypothetical protein [Streptomyces sp. NBC_00328]|uniref:hypothetical protein n=1 Tax=Streptomyces sp. NBC_00328 TaxID=2903646 RepID=UPI002E2C392D|nr:hypothetical protein [Streptomyces sp. NBC_00328]